MGYTNGEPPMAVDVVVHDTRLDGVAPQMGKYTFVVEEGGPLSTLLVGLNHAAVIEKGIGTLNILAHGFADLATGRGGYGVQLGDRNLSLSTVSDWGKLYGKVARMFLYACAVADVNPAAKPGADGDGAALCSKLAFYTGAPVVAATQIQYYNFRWSIWDWTTKQIDFGDWEGPVLEFKPNGAVGPWTG
jgi:hypothetical protein